MDTAKLLECATFEPLGRNIAQLDFKTERVAGTALRASWFWPNLCCVNFTANHGHQELVYSPQALENIPQLPGNRAEVNQNHDARNAVSATVSVLKSSVAVFRPTSSKVSVQNVFLCPFHCKPRPSGVSWEYVVVENIPPVPGNPAQVGQNHDARKAVPATLSVLKSSCAIFRPRGSKVRIPKVLLCPFHCKARPSGVSLEPLGLENISQVPPDRAEVG